jgi:hypothetical protein
MCSCPKVSGIRALRLAAVIGAAFERARHPRFDGVIAGFEGQHQDRHTAVRSAGIEHLLRVEDTAIRRKQSGLRDRPQSPGRGKKIYKLHGPAAAKLRTILQPHPGLRDDAKDTLRADQQPIRARAGARAREPPRLDHALRGDDAERFNQIIDVGVEGGEMTARAGRDPAAERRALETLREMTKREPVRLELRFQRRPESAGLDARRA